MVKVDLEGIKAAIFDMDGTMIANQPWHKQSWKLILKNYGLNMTDEFYRTKISGGKNYWILKKIFPGITEEENNKRAYEKEAIYRKIYKDEVKEVPGLTNLLNKLAGEKFRLAIATTAPKLNRDFAIDKLGLKNIFELIIGDEDVKNAKPNPEVYLKTLDKLNLKGDECIAFEDSPSGIGSAKSAGVKIVVGVLTYHLAKDIKSADFFIKDFTEIELD